MSRALVFASILFRPFRTWTRGMPAETPGMRAEVARHLAERA